MEIIAKVQRRSVELEGTVTGEHGIGLGLRDMLVHEVGESAVDMMRRVSESHESSLSWGRGCVFSDD